MINTSLKGLNVSMKMKTRDMKPSTGHLEKDQEFRICNGSHRIIEWGAILKLKEPHHNDGVMEYAMSF